MRTFLALCIIALALLAACAPAAQEPAAPGVPAREPTARTGPTPEAAEADNQPLLRTKNAEIEAMVEKSSGVKSISFDVASLPDKRAWATYHVRGTKARVDLVDDLLMNGNWYADYIYLDLEKGTAEARCIDIAACKDEPHSGAVPFDRYDIELPQDWGSRVVYGEKTGGVTYNSRQTTVVRWEEDGKTFEAYLDPFYGIAQRVAVLDLTTEPPKITGGYEYLEVTYNKVTAETVTPP